MKRNIFDVIELNNQNKATILNYKDNGYWCEIVNNDGKSLGNMVIYDTDINKVIFTKNK